MFKEPSTPTPTNSPPGSTRLGPLPMLVTSLKASAVAVRDKRGIKEGKGEGKRKGRGKGGKER